MSKDRRNWDVVEFCASGVDLDDDALPLVDAERLLGAVKQMVRASANAAVQPRGHFGQSISKPVHRHTDRIRVGQTRAGGYVIPILSELRQPEVPDGAEPDEAALFTGATYVPFARQAMLRLAGALARLQDFTERDQVVSAQVLNDAVPEGVSFEMCDGIAEALSAESVHRIEVNFHWATDLAAGPDAVTSVSFPRSVVPQLLAMGKSLRVHSVIGKQTVTGTITDLHLGVGEERAKVSMKALVADRARVVTMVLDSEAARRIASDAFHARRQVQVTGRLERERGRTWQFTDVNQFDTLELLRLDV